ncbi:alpha/beta fold hydrolase [Hoeflea sp. WL0058]|uniref:Alpha/beta fold hydrolase n=1 Tax=Flavimaribacter sediminis TaxID=2865987 RepID=A0AAE2ZJ40_9HYPH|nr:alpha/beta fold hydrolase [Flavimaribacter sediminis]MBW8635590.1 alpha/beta fold hydrolase [Flavimaribacter sediminis]
MREKQPIADRDRLVAAMYQATVDPSAYGQFIHELGLYLEQTAANDWKIEDFANVDIGVVEADRGLALHFERMNAALEANPSRSRPVGLRQRVSNAPGFALLIDRGGKIASSSAEARNTFEDGLPSLTELVHRLHSDDGRALQSCISNFAKSGTSGPMRIFRGEAFHLVLRAERDHGEDAQYLVLEALDVVWTEDMEAVLSTSFGLTKAERRIAKALVAGQTVKEIAVEQGRSEGTVRNQSKSILAKTNARSVANLNRIVALVSGGIASTPDHAPNPQLWKREVDLLSLPDGRTLEVRLQGPRDGRPVLMIHGQLFGTEMPARVLKELHTRNIRLITPSRPNFGASSPPPGPPEHEHIRLAQDIAFVMEHYDTGPVPLLAVLGGAVYGYSVAATLRDRISGLVVSGAILPALTPRHFIRLPPTQRLLLFLMRFAPDFLPPLYLSGISQIRANGELPFLETLYREGSRDHAVTVRREFTDILKRSVHFSIAQGYFGIFTDTSHLIWNWSGLVDEVCRNNLPIKHIHGVEDLVTPTTQVKAFLEPFPHVTVTEVKEAGQLLLFEKPAPVFTALDEMITERG